MPSCRPLAVWVARVRRVARSSRSPRVLLPVVNVKLQGALKKLAVQPITGIEEVNMFKEDGNVLHITNPKGAYFSFGLSGY